MNLIDQMIKYLTFLKRKGLPDTEIGPFILNYHDKGKFLFIYDDTYDDYYIIEDDEWKRFYEWNDLIKYYQIKRGK